MEYLLIFLSIICLISVVISILWLNPNFSDKIESLGQHKSNFLYDVYTKEKFLAYTIIALSMFGWLVIFYNTIHGLLWFIPSNLAVHDEVLGWVSLRGKLSLTGGVIATLYTLMYAQKSLGLHRKLKYISEGNNHE